MSARPSAGLGAALALALSAPALLAQEATHTPAATQPSVGKWYLRERLQYLRLSDDPSPEDREIDRFVAITALSYGIRRDLSATAELPLLHSAQDPGAPGRTDRETGAGDLSLSLKWRPLQWDLSPVDSVRVAFFGGTEFPTGSGDFGSHSFDPFGGVALTAILGRHGFNQSLQYKLNTGGEEFGTRPGDGPDDALRYDTAYLFRLSPAAYTADTTAATYLTLELNGVYETGGDNEILFGPGILYEARTFAVEAQVGFPIVRDVDERAETELAVTLGFRILF